MGNISNRVQKKISKIFEFMGFLNQFSNEDITFEFTEVEKLPVPEKYRQLSGLSEEAYQPLYKPKLGPDAELIEKFFTRLKKEPDYKGWSHKRFVNYQLDYLLSFPKKVENEFRRTIYPIENFLEQWSDNEETGDQGEGKPKKGKDYRACAMALYLKDITITLDGIGVNDGVNYVEKFSLTDGRTLYNRLNDINNGRVPDKTGRIKKKAEELVKEKRIGKRQ